MKKPKFIKIPIYNRFFTICNDRDRAKEIYKYYTGYDYDYNSAGTMSCLGGTKYMISIFEQNVSTLNHEITHLALECLDNGDNYDFRKQQEALAYLIGYLSEVIYPKFGLPTKMLKQEVKA